MEGKLRLCFRQNILYGMHIVHTLWSLVCKPHTHTHRIEVSKGNHERTHTDSNSTGRPRIIDENPGTVRLVVVPMQLHCTALHTHT